VIFSTQPLTREEWQPETMTTLLAYEDGRRIFEGTNHKNEYIDSEENMQFLYRIFSDL
jgi:glutamine amidotransferase